MIDLHQHSTYSDGTLSPAALVDLAQKRGLTALAITDHDTVAGTAEALARAAGLAVEVLPGVEISSVCDNVAIHMLGYGFRFEDPLLLRRLGKLQEGRQVRNERIIEKLAQVGIRLSSAELQRYSAAGQTGRPHFARLLVAKGVVGTPEQAFARYLKKGAAAYVDRFKYQAAEAIAMISEAGGLAVLAHPAQIDPALTMIPGLLRKLKDLGLGGVEVYHPAHPLGTVRTLEKIAAGLDLLITGGSDFHGDSSSFAVFKRLKNHAGLPAGLLEKMRSCCRSFTSKDQA